MSQAILQVRDLHAAYGKAEVLHGISFDLHAGEVVTIIGPNGAGKTTLLGSLMGLLPCQGKLSFEGREIHELPLEERVMLGLSLVPERRELFGSMPVEDNLLLGGYRRMRQGVSNWRDELDHVYALFPRLKERREQKAGTLSGGERQMLAVGRALMAKPHILMLDEPSLGLAPLIVKEIFNIIETLKREGVTIILVEQNARAALAVADQAHVLEMGQLGLSGPAAELANDPRVIDTYLGAAQRKEN
ncbi:MAG: ABC transporter ATP-binding protein [Betaproteobacteria bacterium]|jgi:branched-chain amino acid transport system ATP-binding protein|nr:ABC transporter ATP-binding protein [Betaproteobacteria bacterium]NBP44679.1 ABC transporter ATP-binding protein [Betaproteobacteria bacterium]